MEIKKKRKDLNLVIKVKGEKAKENKISKKKKKKKKERQMTNIIITSIRWLKTFSILFLE